MEIRETVCSDCPFRRVAPAGWLGANEPREFAQLALSDHMVHCHSMMVYDSGMSEEEQQEQEEKTKRCRGAAIMMRNQCKLPRDPQAAAVVLKVDSDNETIFSNFLQFIDHHESADVKSWELVKQS
jgi:hypothetical protein